MRVQSLRIQAENTRYQCPNIEVLIRNGHKSLQHLVSLGDC
jgi:hypothetical protein